jgi:hypothetical protein
MTKSGTPPPVIRWQRRMTPQELRAKFARNGSQNNQAETNLLDVTTLVVEILLRDLLDHERIAGGVFEEIGG